MELPALSAVLVDAILAQCPQYDRASVTVALESVFAGHPALLGGNSISMLLGQNNDFTNATITIGSVQAGHTITVQLPQPIDPLPAALAALASIPLNNVPAPRSDLPQASRLPFESSPHFIGREAELKRLAAAIDTAQPSVVMPAVATGLGGIGKTSLVTEFAYRYGVYFHGGVFWLNCADPDQVASQVAACAVGLNFDTTGLSLDEQVQRVLHAWQSPMPRLLIFDNCEDPAILEQWKPTVGGCRVLVTARSDQWPTFTQIRLGLLSPAESRALLQRICARLTDTEADLIATDLGHLPLALHLAGSYLNTYPHHTVAQYRTKLTIAHQSLKGRGALPSPTRHEQDVEATFMLSFNQLDPNDVIDALALGMLDGTGWCAPGIPIPRELVQAFVSDETDADDAVDALRRLQQLSLLDGTDAVVLHRLLAQVVQARLGSMETRGMVEAQIHTEASHINNRGIPNHMLPLEPHLRHVTLSALEGDGTEAPRLGMELGIYLHGSGQYAEAYRLFERIVGLQTRRLGATHLETLKSLNNMAVVLERQGQYAAAQRWFEQVFRVRARVLGPDHPETLQSMNNMATVFLNQGADAAARSLFEQVLAIRLRQDSTPHPDQAASMHNLATVLLRQGETTAAQTWYEQAFALREALFGMNHPSTAESMNGVATAALQQGLVMIAYTWYQQAVMVREQTLGLEHPETATSLNGLGVVFEQQGNWVAARTCYARAVAIREYTLGSHHPDTQLVVANLQRILGRLADPNNSNACSSSSVSPPSFG